MTTKSFPRLYNFSICEFFGRFFKYHQVKSVVLSPSGVTVVRHGAPQDHGSVGPDEKSLCFFIIKKKDINYTKKDEDAGRDSKL